MPKYVCSLNCQRFCIGKTIKIIFRTFERLVKIWGTVSNDLCCHNLSVNKDGISERNC